MQVRVGRISGGSEYTKVRKKAPPGLNRGPAMIRPNTHEFPSAPGYQDRYFSDELLLPTQRNVYQVIQGSLFVSCTADLSWPTEFLNLRRQA